MQRETPQALLVKLIAALQRCRNPEDVFDQIPPYLSQMGLEFGTLSLLNEDGTASVVKVSETCQVSELNRLLEPLGGRFEYQGHTRTIKDTIWHGVYYRGQTMVSDNVLVARNHANIYQVAWKKCLVEYFRNTPVEALLGIIGTRPVLHAIGVNQIVVTPFMVRDRLSGAILIWGSQSKPIDDNQIEIVEVCGRIVSLALSGILRSQDIKRSLDNVEFTEFRYTKLVQSAPVAIIQLDYQTNRLAEVNEAACELTGYSREELLSMDPLDLLTPDSRKSFIDRMSALRQGITPRMGADYQVVRKDKTEIWGHFQTRIVFHQGKPAYGETIAFDVTELKRSEEAMRRRIEIETLISRVSTAFIDLLPAEIDVGMERVLQAIGMFGGLSRCYFVQLAPDGSLIERAYEWCTSDLEPQILRWQDMPTEAFPWWMKRLAKFETVYVSDVESLPAEAATEKEILQTHQTPSVVLHPIVSGWGLIGFLGLAASHPLDEWAQEDFGLIHVVSDTIAGALEQYRANEQLRESQEKFNAIANATFDAIVTMDDSTRVAFWNPAAERMFGLSALQVMGTPICEILYPGRYRETFARIITELQEAGQTEQPGRVLSLTALRPNGTEFPVEMALTSTSLKGQWWAVALIRDLSRRRTATTGTLPGLEPLEMSGAYDLPDRSVRRTALDANNLCAVMGRLCLLLEQETGPEDPRRTDILSLYQTAQRGLHIHSKLLQLPSAPSPPNRGLTAKELIQQAEHILRPLLPNHIVCNRKLPADLKPIAGDVRQLTQVMINLLLNAVEAMPKGGTITVEGQNMTLGPDELSAHPGHLPGVYVLIRVRDTGIGMGDEVLTHATEPFFTTKADKEALGLGLSMVYGTIEQHGGIVTMNSQPNLGTVVSILLPVWRESDS